MSRHHEALPLLQLALSPLDPLWADPEVEDVLIQRPGEAWVRYRGEMTLHPVALDFIDLEGIAILAGSLIVTSNLPFEEWTAVLGSERLTGALLDRLTHHVHILAMNGESYRLAHSTARRRVSAKAAPDDAATSEQINQDTGEILPG